MSKDIATTYITSTHQLYREARADFESYDPEDLDDGEGNKSVIVDTVLSMYGYDGSDVGNAIETLGGSVDDCCERCQAEGRLLTGEDGERCEWLEETLEDVAGKQADKINAHLPAGAVGSFNFEWFDGAYVLAYTVTDN